MRVGGVNHNLWLGSSKISHLLLSHRKSSGFHFQACQDFSLMMGAPINDEGKRIYGDACLHLRPTCLPWAMDVTDTSLDEYLFARYPSLLLTTKTTDQKLKRCSWKTILFIACLESLFQGSRCCSSECTLIYKANFRNACNQNWLTSFVLGYS